MKTPIYTALSVVLLITSFHKTMAQGANKALSNLTNPTAVNENLLPDKTNKRTIGNSNKAWNSLYLDSTIFFLWKALHKNFQSFIMEYKRRHKCYA